MSTRTYTILWLDDEPYYVESHAEAITSDPRFHLIPVRTVHEALEKINDSQFKLDLLIWDMVLPSGSLDPKETERGLRTGAVFFRLFRERFRGVPAILFTNINKQGVHQMYHAPESGSRVYQKYDLLPAELVEKIEEMLGLEHHSEH